MHIWHIFFSAKRSLRSGIGQKIKVRLFIGFLLLTIWLGLPMPVMAQAIDSMASQMAAQVAADQVAKEQTPESTAEAAPEAAAELAVGESLFTTNCAACHANGGNIIRRGKNLKQKAMVRNGYGEVDAIALLITQGKGAMPAYADRLSEGEIEAIAQYTHQKATTSW
jgi:cytochrome c6